MSNFSTGCSQSRVSRFLPGGCERFRATSVILEVLREALRLVSGDSLMFKVFELG